jgi:hypothetical protein
MRSSSQRHCHSTSRRYCFHPGSKAGALVLPPAASLLALSPDFSSPSPASAGPSFLERSPEVPCRAREGLSPAPRLGSDAPGAPESDLCSAALGALSACSPSSTRRSTASPVSVKLLHPLIPFARTSAQADFSSSFAFSVNGAGSVIARGVLLARLRTRFRDLRRSRKSRRFAAPRSPRRVRRGRRRARDRTETRRSLEGRSHRTGTPERDLETLACETGERRRLGASGPNFGAFCGRRQHTRVRAASIDSSSRPRILPPANRRENEPKKTRLVPRRDTTPGDTRSRASRAAFGGVIDARVVACAREAPVPSWVVRRGWGRT